MAVAVVLAHAPAAGASSLALQCAGPAVSGATSAPVSAAAPSTVPEDGAALIEVRPSLPAAASAASVSAVTVTFTIPQQVADVDLTFAGGNVPARRWDARGGERIVVYLEAPVAVPYATAQLPAITIVNTFDPGSSGRTISWPVYRSLSVTTVGEGAGTTECSTGDPGASWASTSIATPTQKHEEPILARDATVRVNPDGSLAPPPASAPGAPGAPAPGGAPSATVAATDPAAPASSAVAAGAPSTSAAPVGTAPDAGVEDATRPGLTAAGKPVWVLVIAGLIAAGVVGMLVWFARGERGMS